MYEELNLPALGVDGFADYLRKLAVESGYSIGVVQLRHLIAPTGDFNQKFNTEYVLSSPNSRYSVKFKTRSGMPPQIEGEYDPQYHSVCISRENLSAPDNRQLIACFNQTENWQLMPNPTGHPIDDILNLPTDVVSYSERPVASESFLQIWETGDPLLSPLIQALRNLSS